MNRYLMASCGALLFLGGASLFLLSSLSGDGLRLFVAGVLVAWGLPVTLASMAGPKERQV